MESEPGGKVQTDVAAEIGVEEAAGVVEVIAFHGASVKNELAEVVDRGGFPPTP